MITIRCKKHKSYEVKRKPRVACFACWFLWKIKSDGQVDYYGVPLEVVKEKT
jgi:hypothetical protein